jgi:hypothetical protein
MVCMAVPSWSHRIRDGIGGKRRSPDAVSTDPSIRPAGTNGRVSSIFRDRTMARPRNPPDDRSVVADALAGSYESLAAEIDATQERIHSLRLKMKLFKESLKRLADHAEMVGRPHR